MKFRINLYARKFNKEENIDSGYYRPTKCYKGVPTGRIDINLADNPLEQILTVFHEVTHMIFDIYTKYEVNNRARTIKKRKYNLWKDWRSYNKEIEKSRKDGKSREEQICCNIERVVKNILKTYIPKKYKKKMFTK